MLGALKAELDMANFNSRIATWSKVAGVSLAEGMRKQAALLKWELMESAPPKNLAKSKAKAKKDSKKTFFPNPSDPFSGPKKTGKGMIWLYAGKKNGKFLVGTDPKDYQLGISETAMDKLQDQQRSGFFRGAAWHQIGLRGKKEPFHVMRLNRTVVGRGKFNQFIKRMQDSFGKLKAAWAVDLPKVGESRTVPKWIAKHIPKAKGKTIISLDGPKPFIQIISNARGVEHQRSIDNVRRAVKKRSGSMVADMRLYLAGVKKKSGFKAGGLVAPLWVFLYSQSVDAAPAFVSDSLRIPQHQALTHRAVDGEEHFAQVVEVFDHARFDSARHATVANGPRCALQAHHPIAGNVRGIEHHESNGVRPLAVLRSQSGGLESIPTSPQFAVQSESSREQAREFNRGFDAVPVACPQIEPIPESPAAVQLFAEPPARQIGFAIPIFEQRHVAFVHALTVADGGRLANSNPNPFL